LRHLDLNGVFDEKTRETERLARAKHPPFFERF
jgi:hypothetical protein